MSSQGRVTPVNWSPANPGRFNALLLENATTIAKVGFFLEQHRERLMVEEHHLEQLRKHAPRTPHYLSRGSRRPGKLVAGWNLVVPPEVIDRRWQEIP